MWLLNESSAIEKTAQYIPWFFTGVTYPLVLQSTEVGRMTPLGGRNVEPFVPLEK